MLGTITMGTSAIANVAVLYIFATSSSHVHYRAIAAVFATEIVVCGLLMATTLFLGRRLDADQIV